MEIELTKEDLQINRAVAKRIGSWEWLDSRVPSRQLEIKERANARTASRSCIGFVYFAKVLAE